MAVVPGFRDRVRGSRVPVSPRAEWGDAEFAAAAERRLRQVRRRMDELGPLDGLDVLEIGAGAGADCLFMRLSAPVGSVTGIDLEPRADPRSQRLAREVLRAAGLPGDVDAVPLQVMDATAMTFADESFDVLVSRSAMEHIRPVEQALAEMARVARPGALIHHAIDPYYWLRGCHKRGLVDIPWAHARLTLAEYRRFVTETEGPDLAAERTRRLETLNAFTPRKWRAVLDGVAGLEVVDWREERSPLAEELLAEHPDAREGLLDGVEPGDLVCGRIKVRLRKPA